MTHFIAVDIGGTQLRAACYVDDQRTPAYIDKIATQGPSTTPLERLIGLIAGIWPGDNCVEAIGVAAAGPTDPFAGILLDAPNIPGWDDFPLRQFLEDRFGVPVSLGNDANLAALGEWQYGSGKGYHHMIYITVSTGIGAGIIVDDRLLLGARGLAAELGHTSIVPDGPMCGCGRRGHLESMAAGPAIARWAEEQLNQGIPSILPAGQPLTAKDVGMAAFKGDQLAIEAIARSGHFLGKALANFVHIFNPTRVIIGGGVSRCGPLLLDPMRESLAEHVISHHYIDDLTIATAALGDEAGLMGALALAHGHAHK
ncbi:MAG: ROK family protein [Chloroflexota bacterium]|nr:MAG: ROK family protein [Chloroflexota bacterium]